ncbi:lysylphosphatidylglycerol synthase transmembrane domain-containing protein [Nocardioides rubriscoriae]|uniref:lysylphosphatidylglycerol synthase transmembrane domain-containing protein n=1 Tax=Nocardioides rubriscoriae TaxID=642762 RepID=UPI0014789CB1|nr:lysylphosphatidylglycerol synthase transmembrane domain-containing protein [Nocardioides rubriscoriae]
MSSLRRPAVDPPVPARHGSGRHLVRWATRVGGSVVALALVAYLVLPELVAARGELWLFVDGATWRVGLAALLQLVSLMAYTALTLAVLDRSVRPSFGLQLRIDVTGFGASHVLPGGGASAAALRYRLMTVRGVPPPDAASTAAVQTATVVAGLVAIFATGVVLALPGIWAHPAYVLAALVGLCLLAVALVVTPRRREPGRRRRSPDHRRDSGARRAWALRQRERAGSAVRRTGERAAVSLHDRRRRRRLLGWAVGNRLPDAAGLWLCLWAYGIVVPPGELLVAYAAASLAGLLPLTPGGLGVVESVLVPTLTVLADAGGPVVLGVLTWRALQFWLPIPISWLTWASLCPWRAPSAG